MIQYWNYIDATKSCFYLHKMKNLFHFKNNDKMLLSTTKILNSGIACFENIYTEINARSAK